MIKKYLEIEYIPAILWGEQSDRLFIAIHGNMSSKDDVVIQIFAEEAVAKGYQVLSFDLPEHGERTDHEYSCKVQNCVTDLTIIQKYVTQNLTSDIRVFACSIGAYFSLLAYKDLMLRQCLFLSPVIDMLRLINNMMSHYDINEDRLKIENEIETPTGNLYWEYYLYVRSHPIDKWDTATSILYGSRDTLTEMEVISSFAKRFHCTLDILEGGEHYFHQDKQLEYFTHWLRNSIFP